MSANAGASPEGDAVFRHKGDHIRESVANRAAYFCIWDAHMPLAMSRKVCTLRDTSLAVSFSVSHFPRMVASVGYIGYPP